MHVKDCKITAFGRICDQEISNLDSDLVVVLGPNEIGKSTLFEFFKTMIYGIYPTSPENHDYAPWSGQRLEGSLSFRLSDGSEHVVSRRLLKKPEGYILNGERRNIRNQTIPAAAHISRQLFDSIFALTLAEMTSIHEKPWHEIEERLLGELKLDVLRPMKVVVKELEDEASSLWRDDNRGKPRARVIEKEIKDLRKLAQTAANRDEETRQLQASSEEIAGQIGKLKAKRVRVKSRQAELERLLPCRKLLVKIEEARRQAGNPADLEGFPETPADHLQDLRDSIAPLREKIIRARERVNKLREEISMFTENDRKVLKSAPEIRDWAKRSISYDQLIDQLAGAKTESAEAIRQADLAATRVLSRGLNDEIADNILAVSEEELTGTVKGQMEAQATLDKLEHKISTSSSAHSYLPSIFLATLGLGLCLTTIFRSGDLLLATGLALFALGTAWSVSVWLKKREEDQRLGQSSAEATRSLEMGSSKIAQMLSRLPVLEGRLAKPDLVLANDIAHLKATAIDMKSRKSAVTAIEQRATRTLDGLDLWIESLDPGLQTAGFDTVRRLQVSLEEAGKREIRSDHASVAEADATQALSLLEKDLATRTEELRRLKLRLSALGNADIGDGLEVLKTRRNALMKAEHLQATLEEEYPDWEDLQQEHTDLDYAGVSAEIACCKCELEEIGDQIQHLSSEEISHRKDMQHLETKRAVADLESEIDQLNSDVADVKFRRDRLLLLAKIIRHGNQRFREQHQPDVLRRASEYLSIITGGRYVRLELDEHSQSLEVLPARQLHPIPVSRPLSQGIRDQIYLSLRLALVEHLDDAFEHLPLFLDEILVNWDEGRRKRGYAVFKKIMSSRQIFIFTCHPWLANELTSELGGKQVTLSKP